MIFSDSGEENILIDSEELQEINSIKEQINLIWQEIYSAYTQIGKKYTAYAAKYGDIPEADTYELLMFITEKNIQKEELEDQIQEILLN